MLERWMRQQPRGLSCEEQGDGRSALLSEETASESGARLVTQRRRKRSPGAAPRQVLPSGERNRSDPHRGLGVRCCVQIILTSEIRSAIEVRFYK